MMRLHTAVFLAVLLAPAVVFAQAGGEGRGCGGEGGAASGEVSCITLMGDDGARVTIEDRGDRIVIGIEGDYAQIPEEIRTLAFGQIEGRVAADDWRKALAALEGGEKRVEMAAKAAEDAEEACGGGDCGQGGGCGEGRRGRGRGARGAVVLRAGDGGSVLALPPIRKEVTLRIEGGGGDGKLVLRAEGEDEDGKCEGGEAKGGAEGEGKIEIRLNDLDLGDLDLEDLDLDDLDLPGDLPPALMEALKAVLGKFGVPGVTMKRLGRGGDGGGRCDGRGDCGDRGRCDGGKCDGRGECGSRKDRGRRDDGCSCGGRGRARCGGDGSCGGDDVRGRCGSGGKCGDWERALTAGVEHGPFVRFFLPFGHRAGGSCDGQGPRGGRPWGPPTFHGGNRWHGMGHAGGPCGPMTGGPCGPAMRGPMMGGPCGPAMRGPMMRGPGGPCGGSCGPMMRGPGGPCGGPMAGAPGGTDAAILEALKALTREIRALREDVRAQKAPPPPPAPPAADMGGATFRVIEPGKGPDGRPRFAVVAPGAAGAAGFAAVRADAEIVRLKAELQALRAALMEIRQKLEAPAEK